MTSKIVAGVAMTLPAYGAYVYSTIENNECLTSALVRSGKDVLKFAGLFALVGLGWLGTMHIASGLYDVSPSICPRD